MHSADGRLVLTYNGEIYNHRELRAALEAEDLGPAGGWRGHSDTETLIEAIAAWGLDTALERSVGMFAFALWDRRDRTLSLARDRFGEKPLYYGWAGRDFAFGSELKAVRAHPRFDATIDPAARSPLRLTHQHPRAPPAFIATSGSSNRAASLHYRSRSVRRATVANIPSLLVV